jgi:hypothetical protein
LKPCRTQLRAVQEYYVQGCAISGTVDRRYKSFLSSDYFNISTDSVTNESISHWSSDRGRSIRKYPIVSSTTFRLSKWNNLQNKKEPLRNISRRETCQNFPEFMWHVFLYRNYIHWFIANGSKPDSRRRHTSIQVNKLVLHIRKRAGLAIIHNIAEGASLPLHAKRRKSIMPPRTHHFLPPIWVGTPSTWLQTIHHTGWPAVMPWLIVSIM